MKMHSGMFSKNSSVPVQFAKMKILSIVGARPNFMKVAPLHRAFLKHPEIDSRIVHTGQHYDARMSDIFFNQLGLPQPDYFLGIGGGSHTQQTANIMLAFEKILLEEKPDMVLVVGDVNSTVACTLVAVKEHIPVAHVEAGLRSGDRTMPEEINRLVTDSISDLLFVSEQSGVDNLAREGVPEEKVWYVGNVMIDSLVYFREQAERSTILEQNGLSPGGYALITMHRPANVDTPEGLASVSRIVLNTAGRLKAVFPIHPRTLKNMERFGLLDAVKEHPNVLLMEPQGYFEFLKLIRHAKVVLTDSGGIQEETTYLQVPCMTFRNNTERPVTVTLGTNILLQDMKPEEIDGILTEILNGKIKDGAIPPLWDGRTAERIAEILLTYHSKAASAVHR